MSKILLSVKKYLAFGVLTLAVAVLGISNYQLHNKINIGSNKVLSFEEKMELDNRDDKSAETLLSRGTANQFPPESLPHPNCQMQLIHGYPVSDVYNPDTPYNLSFFQNGQTGFQEINGDGLPDFVYVSTNYGGTNPESNYTGCVYLNNGSGWTKAHICSARTVTDSEGNIQSREYRGDCAGEPSAKASDNE